MPDVCGQILKRSVLFESQEKMGADFDVVHGWEMPARYSSTEQEHLAVRSNVGLVDLSYFGVVRISGSESVQFLNGLVTNNVKSLAPGSGMRAALLTGHGKVKALCRVLNLGDEFLVINDPKLTTISSGISFSFPTRETSKLKTFLSSIKHSQFKG